MTEKGLDPLYYYTLPGFFWDATLKMTKVHLELFPEDQSMMAVFFEKGICGGLSMIFHRRAYANNQDMGDEYNPEKQSEYIKHYDVNNLYGKAMMMPLPYGGFKWMKKTE